MTPTSGKHQPSSHHDVQKGNVVAGLLVPHTSSDKKGDKLSQSSRTSLAPPSSIILVEQPKRKKRKYHPELVGSGSVLSPHPSHPPAPPPSRFQLQSQHSPQSTQASDMAWDDGIYVGENNHPLFHISSVPPDVDDTPRGKESLHSFIDIYANDSNVRHRLQQIICRPGFC